MIIRAARKLFDFLFSNLFLHVSFAFFPLFSQIIMLARMEVLLNLVSIWSPKSITTHVRIFKFLGFCWAFCRAAKKLISCFLISFKHYVESFCWHFLIFWPFIYSNLVCVCGYCLYGLFLALMLLLKIMLKKSPGIQGWVACNLIGASMV